MKNVTFNFLGVNVVNQSIKFFTIFLLAFNVFAGGDDRDKEYYEALDEELAAFEAQLDAELAAQEMMAEIIADEERAKRLAEFQAKLEAEKAAAAASTAAYQAKLAEEKAAAAELAAFKAVLAAHEECKTALNLSDSNIALFKTALAAGNLFSVGPQITAGTEFTANRWDDYASCIGALNYKNPF